jgi:hypothetical protein
VLVEGRQIILLYVEVDLVDQCLFERVLAHWDFVSLGEEGEEAADSKEDVDVPLDIFVHIGVAHLHRNFLTLVDRLVDLAD